MWHYSYKSKPAGPVDEGTLVLLLSSGLIDADTLVWRGGLKEWVRIGETALTSKVSRLEPSQVRGGKDRPGLAPASTPSHPLYRPNPFRLKRLYIAWLIMLALAFTACFLTIPSFHEDAYWTFILCALGLSLAAYVLMVLLTRRFWKVIQDGYTRSSPGEAVGFLFIPAFRFYWLFRAFVGLSRGINQFIERRFGDTVSAGRLRTKPALAIAYCVLFLMNYPYTLYFVFMAAPGYSYSPNPTYIWVIINFVLSVISVAMIADIYRVIREILA
jgi:hypothetical protein